MKLCRNFLHIVIIGYVIVNYELNQLNGSFQGYKVVQSKFVSICVALYIPKMAQWTSLSKLINEVMIFINIF